MAEDSDLEDVRNQLHMNIKRPLSPFQKVALAAGERELIATSGDLLTTPWQPLPGDVEGGLFVVFWNTNRKRVPPRSWLNTGIDS